jgi:hypothetical protein
VNSSSLGSSATASTRSDSASTATAASEAASSATRCVLVEAAAALACRAIEGAAATATRTSASPLVELAGLTTLLDVALVGTDPVWVGRDRGLEAGNSGELYEGTVLSDC